MGCFGVSRSDDLIWSHSGQKRRHGIKIEYTYLSSCLVESRCQRMEGYRGLLSSLQRNTWAVGKRRMYNAGMLQWNPHFCGSPNKARLAWPTLCRHSAARNENDLKLLVCAVLASKRIRSIRRPLSIHLSTLPWRRRDNSVGRYPGGTLGALHACCPASPRTSNNTPVISTYIHKLKHIKKVQGVVN